jgi:hypothetical protein
MSKKNKYGRWDFNMMYVHHLEVSQKKLSGLKALILLIYLHIDYGVMEIIPDKSKILCLVI